MKISAILLARILAALSGAAVFLILGCQPVGPRGDYVVLIHGMKRTHRSMRPMGRFLAGKGYQVVNLEFESANGTVAELAEWAGREIRARCPDPSRRVHFVTHSLGGILVRALAPRAPDIRWGRVVMLSPPNQGSELTDTFKDWKLYGWINGPSGLELGTGTNDLPAALGPVKFDLGVIAGDRTLNPLYSSIVKKPNDGKVSVASAQVEGMKDFLVVHSTHTFIMQRRPVMEQVAAFLANGRFHR